MAHAIVTARLALTVDGAGTKNGTKILLAKDNKSDAQLWSLTKQDNGSYAIEPKHAPGLAEELKANQDFGIVVGRSQAFEQVLTLARQAAPTGATVMVTGETGTGKEVLARAIHERSLRRDRAFVRLNCAALPSGLIESELFGHVRGAFTGAEHQRVGQYELADGGTLCLDEVGEMPLQRRFSSSQHPAFV